MNKTPYAVAALVAIQIPSADDDFLRIRCGRPVIRLGINLTLGRIAIDHEQRIGNAVDCGLKALKHIWQPSHKIVHRSAEHIAVIVDRVIVIEAAQQRIVAPVASPAVSQHQIV